MALSNREQKIMILAVAAIVILMGDKYVLQPLLETREETSEMKRSLKSQLDEANEVIKREKVQKSRWDNMLNSGLSYDNELTEQRVIRFIKDSSSNSRFSLNSIQPEHQAKKEKFGQIDFLVSGTGSMESVTRLLWLIETSNTVPVRIESMTLGANNDDAQVMSLQLNLSSIYMIEEAQKEAQ
jgi:Tfp pilus assembly protein PilO